MMQLRFKRGELRLVVDGVGQPVQAGRRQEDLLGAGAARAYDGGDSPAASTDLVDLSRSHAFYAASAGGEPAGVATEPQRHCVYMTFDLVTEQVRDLQVLLARWSAGIAQLMAGQTIALPER